MTGQVVSLRELVNPTPRQEQFLDTVRGHLFTLYGGAAGGGKSYILRWTLVALLMRWAKAGLLGVRVGLFCEDYPALRERHLSKIRYEFPPWLGRLRENVHEFQLSPRFGAGVIAFRNLDDPSKYLSSEFGAAAVDELTRNGPEVFDALRMRLRWPGIDRPVFLGASNPGGRGHGWVKRLWVDRDFPEELQALAREFAYVPARAADNPHLPASYADSLASLPPDLRRAYLEGDWDLFQGQVFSAWRRELHVEEPWPLPAGTRFFTSADRGFAAPSAVLRWAILPSGDLRVIGELYVPGMVTSELGRRWLELGAGDYGVADPAMWAKSGHTGEAEAEVLQRMGVPLQPADNDRLNGKARVHEWLRLIGGQPRLRVWTTCPNLIRTLPALPYSKTRPEDVDTDAEDHAYDALRYGLMSRPTPDDQPKAKEPVTDPAERERLWLERMNEAEFEGETKRKGYW